MKPHPFDAALHLASTQVGEYTGQTSPAYWNMVGPFGGITAATVLAAVMRHPQRLGVPLSLTVNFAGALSEGPYQLLAQPVRTNRSTQHLTVTLLQPDEQGQPVVTTTATVVTATRRETWSLSDMPMPAVPAPAAVPPMQLDAISVWFQRYEFRPIQGGLPQRWDGGGDSSLTQLWMRDAPARALDLCALAAMADVFYPRVWLRRAVKVPAGTVSITTYFHAGDAELAATGRGYVLGQARAQEFRNGFFDQSAQLWNEAGVLLCTSHQLVYFKE